MTKKSAENSKFTVIPGCYIFVLNNDVNTKAKLLLLGMSEEDILLNSVFSENHAIDSENIIIHDRSILKSVICNFHNLISELNKRVFFVISRFEYTKIIDQPSEDCFVLLAKRAFLDDITDQYIDDENNDMNLKIYYAYSQK